MSIGATQHWQYPPVTGVAPDQEERVDCHGCTRMTLEVANQSILIRWGRGPADQITWDPYPEPYMPTVAQIYPADGFDAFKWQALTPAAGLPAGALQAFAYLIALP